MSAHKPICKRFLSGECMNTNCKFYHPHSTIKPNHATKPLLTYHMNACTFYNSTQKACMIHAGLELSVGCNKLSNNVTETIQYTKLAPIPRISYVAKITNNITLHTFNKEKFLEWFNNELSNDMLDGKYPDIITKKLFCSLLKKTEPDSIAHIMNVDSIIPDIMALIGHGCTNKLWLKELYDRFLGNSYIGIKSFNMKTINDLLVFAIIQIYVKIQIQDFQTIYHMICLYVCIMRLIKKLNSQFEIDSVDIIEKNYNNNMYDMVKYI